MKKIICLIAGVLFLFSFLPATFANDNFVIEDDVLVEYIGQDKHVVIPDGITNIGKSAFQDTDIVSVIISDSVVTIDGYAFYNCENLEYVSLSHNLKNISLSCFGSCSNLKFLAIPTTAQYIGDGAFANINALTIHIPPSVYSIGDFAFWGSEDALTIVGEKGSAAERFAAKWDIKFVAANRKYEDFARPSSTVFIINETPVDFDAYIISNNNYVKLHDFAFALKDTERKFSVNFSEKRFYLKTGEAYLPTGNEMSKNDNVIRDAVYSTPLIFLNGKSVDIETYRIDGEYFFKLRDVATLFEIAIEWDALTQTATLYV